MQPLSRFRLSTANRRQSGEDALPESDSWHENVTLVSIKRRSFDDQLLSSSRLERPDASELTTITQLPQRAKRRTLILQKVRGSFGFTIQTYGVTDTETNEIETFNYVDYVELNSSASKAGLQPGDVLLSVNGIPAESMSHDEIVKRISKSGNKLRVVVVFQDIVNKINLYLRFLKLRKIINQKVWELRALHVQEQRILQGLPAEERNGGVTGGAGGGGGGSPVVIVTGEESIEGSMQSMIDDFDVRSFCSGIASTVKRSYASLPRFQHSRLSLPELARTANNPELTNSPELANSLLNWGIDSDHDDEDDNNGADNRGNDSGDDSESTEDCVTRL